MTTEKGLEPQFLIAAGISFGLLFYFLSSSGARGDQSYLEARGPGYSLAAMQNDSLCQPTMVRDGCPNAVFVMTSTGYFLEQQIKMFDLFPGTKPTFLWIYGGMTEGLNNLVKANQTILPGSGTADYFIYSAYNDLHDGVSAKESAAGVLWLVDQITGGPSFIGALPPTPGEDDVFMQRRTAFNGFLIDGVKARQRQGRAVFYVDTAGFGDQNGRAKQPLFVHKGGIIDLVHPGPGGIAELAADFNNSRRRAHLGDWN